MQAPIASRASCSSEDASSFSASLSNSNSFKDPFASHSQDPWQQLDLDEGVPADAPLPEILPEATQHSINNEDDTIISSADPAACDFLLAALTFHEQQSVKASLQDSPHDDPVVLVAVSASSKAGSDKVATPSKPTAAKGLLASSKHTALAAWTDAADTVAAMTNKDQ